MKAWVGRRFDAERFDVHAVNKKLAALARRLGARRAPVGAKARAAAR